MSLGMRGGWGVLAAIPLLWLACGGDQFSSGAPPTAGGDASVGGTAGSSGVGGSAGASGGAAGAANGGSPGQGGSAGTAGSGGTAGSAPCGDEACVDPPEGGWGDWTLVDWVTTEPVLASACPTAVIARWDAGSIQPPACHCTCGKPVDMTCKAELKCGPGSSDCHSEYSGIATPACSVATLAVSGTTCATGTLWAAGTCLPDFEGVKSNSKPTVSACSMPSHESCGTDSRCVGAPPQDARGPCISAAGEHDCPKSYPDRRVVFDTFEDHRKCGLGSCSCLPTTGGCDVAAEESGVKMTHGGCGGTSSTVVPFGAVCTQLSLSGGGSSVIMGMTLIGVSYSPDSAQPCTATGIPAVVGDAAPESPVTICCKQ